MSAWQPIETAPKDGSDILVFLDGNGEDFSRIAVVYWRNAGFREFAWDCQIHTPTHWQPLPEPPK